MPVSRARSARLSNCAERSAAARRKRSKSRRLVTCRSCRRIPLQVGRHVGPEEALRVDVPVLVQLWKAAAHQEALGGQIGMRRLRLGERERLELDDRGAARQRIGDRLHQAERLRGRSAGRRRSARARESTAVFRCRNSPGAYCTSSRTTGGGCRARKVSGSRSACSASLGRSSVTKAWSGKSPPHQAGLPGLPGAGQQHDRPRRGALQEKRLDATVESTSCKFYDYID